MGLDQYLFRARKLNSSERMALDLIKYRKDALQNLTLDDGFSLSLLSEDEWEQTANITELTYETDLVISAIDREKIHERYNVPPNWIIGTMTLADQAAAFVFCPKDNPDQRITVNLEDHAQYIAMCSEVSNPYRAFALKKEFQWRGSWDTHETRERMIGHPIENLDFIPVNNEQVKAITNPIFIESQPPLKEGECYLYHPWW